MRRTSIEPATNAATFVAEEFWPSPLTPLEWFLCKSHRSDYPTSMLCQLNFLGEMDRADFAAAYSAAITRHPLLRSRVSANANGRLFWTPDDAPLAPVDWGDDKTPFLPWGVGFDLTRESGVRAAVRVGEQRSVLMLEFQHACCDGHGMMRVVEDLLAGYAAAQAGIEPESALWPLNYGRLRERGRYLPSRRPPGAGLQDAIWRGSEAASFLSQAPRPLAPGDRGDSLSPRRRPAISTHYLTKDESRAIRASVAADRGTLNDLYLSVVFKLLAEWNLRHDLRADQGNLRILMPVDLRVPGDEALPAANAMTFGFLNRRAVECQDMPSLLAGIRRETLALQEDRSAVEILDVLGALAASPRAAELIVGSSFCLATAIVTNLGDPTRRFFTRLPRKGGLLHVGNLLVESATGFPPLRPRTRVAFGFGAYGGRIVLSLRWDPRCYTDRDADMLMQDYIAPWRRLAGTG